VQAETVERKQIVDVNGSRDVVGNVLSDLRGDVLLNAVCEKIAVINLEGITTCLLICGRNVYGAIARNPWFHRTGLENPYLHAHDPGLWAHPERTVDPLEVLEYQTKRRPFRLCLSRYRDDSTAPVFRQANRQLGEQSARMGLEIFFRGKKYFINSDRLQILNLFLSTYESAIQKNQELTDVTHELRALNVQLADNMVELEMKNRELHDLNVELQWQREVAQESKIQEEEAAIQHWLRPYLRKGQDSGCFAEERNRPSIDVPPVSTVTKN
jgi:hypothetical protein